MNSNDFYKSKYSKYKNKYLELKQKNLKFNQEGGIFESRKYLFYIKNSEFITNRYKIDEGLEYNKLPVPHWETVSYEIKKDDSFIKNFEKLKNLSILIIPLGIVKDNKSQITYKASDNTYKDHDLTIENIDLLNYDKLNQSTDELLKIAMNQIPDFNEQIDKENKLKIEKDKKIEEKEEKIKKIKIEIEEKNTEILKANEQKNNDVNEIKILKENEVSKGTEIDKLNENIKNLNTKIRKLLNEIEVFDKEIDKLEFQKNKKEELILRLTFKIYKIYPNVLVNKLYFTP